LNSRTTRLAPSPTGTLHLGHARTFLYSWALARTQGWRIVLRLEDLDHTRIRPGAHEETIDLLHWMGMDWDGPVRVLSRNLEPYRDAMRRLERDRRIFRCDRSRRELIQDIGAPHAGEGEAPHPAHLRPADEAAYRFADEHVNYRLCVDEETVRVEDRIAGLHHFRPIDEAGDFLVWSKLGVPAYQLAITVDDGADGITDVVRGDDLLASAARQQIVHRLLDQPIPLWWHLPLVTDGAGQRLAKRRGDQRLAVCRDAGIPGDAVIGLVAYWCGLRDAPEPMSAANLLKEFDPQRLPRDPVALTDPLIAWLMEQR